MNYFNNLLETAAELKTIRDTFEEELRAGLKTELMGLAEVRIDRIIDDAIKSLQTRTDAVRDLRMDQTLVKITVHRLSEQY